MKKFILIICLLLGLPMIGFGGYNTGLIVYDSLKTEEYKANVDSNNKVIVKDTLTSTGTVKDDLFDVEVDSAVLVRDVEMVQWYKDEEKGIRLVLANYQLDSFEDDGVKYENPKFYTDIKSEVFYGTATIKELEVDKSVLEGVVKEFYKGNLEKTYYKDLVNDKNKAYDLVIRDGDYVTPSNEWQLGDVRVSYYYLDDTAITVVGNIHNSKISISNNGLVYGKDVTRQEILKDLMANIYVYGTILVIGLVLVIIGLIVGKKKKKKNNNNDKKEEIKKEPILTKDETKTFEDDVLARLQNIINEQNK